ncbi:MAG: hypothetical protein MUF54_18100 [Polyangiaceae bacterium]|jgi:hypothetical protein|nr:hypothetical protein [Polyangiaceae bacterium]
MVAEENAAWVRPPEPKRWLDHLGVQAPCVALYTQLLPGITNVTDRARYYSFHPWVIWSFEQRYAQHSLDEFRRVLRRAECLFALIAIRHSRVTGGDDEGRHGAGMVGRLELLRIPEDDESIRLDDYAALEGPKRYFMNKLGGLGQYYFGPLRDLRVLDRSPQGPSYPPGYDRTRGRELAEAFSKGVPDDAFWRAIEAPSLGWEDLDVLAPFCPCFLTSNTPEHELLLDLFLARSEPYQHDGGPARRASLALMLDLAGSNSRHPDYAFESVLRGASYSGALPDGVEWKVSPCLRRAQRGWGTYRRNELLSIAVQGLFAAVLRAIERDRQGCIPKAADAADVTMQLLAPQRIRAGSLLRDLVAQSRANLPAIQDWRNPKHELERGWRLHGIGLEDARLEEVASESVHILLALIARGLDDYPYGDFDLDPEYFEPGEVHLLSLRQRWRAEWVNMSFEGWIRWLSVHWGVARHLRVALRKLRSEQRDTFRIRPLEGELRVVAAPAPTYTSPPRREVHATASRSRLVRLRGPGHGGVDTAWKAGIGGVPWLMKSPLLR